MSRLPSDREISVPGVHAILVPLDSRVLGLRNIVCAHIVATNLPSYAEVAGVGALMIGVLLAAYDLAELFAKPLAGFVADRQGDERNAARWLKCVHFRLVPLSLLSIHSCCWWSGSSKGLVRQGFRQSPFLWSQSISYKVVVRPLGSTTR